MKRMLIAGLLIASTIILAGTCLALVKVAEDMGEPTDAAAEDIGEPTDAAAAEIDRLKAENAQLRALCAEMEEWHDADQDAQMELAHEIDRLEAMLADRGINIPMEQAAEDADEPQTAEITVADIGWNYVGVCRITHYCACQRCTGKAPGDVGYGITRTGTHVAEFRTVAVDPHLIPLGSEVKIGGRIYVAEDTGVRGNAVDIYVASHDEALRRGMYNADVFWR